MREKIKTVIVIILVCIFLLGFVPLYQGTCKCGEQKEVFALWYRHIQWNRRYDEYDAEYLDDPKYAKYFEPIETGDGSVDGYWVRTDFYVFPFNFISLEENGNFFE